MEMFTRHGRSYKRPRAVELDCSCEADFLESFQHMRRLLQASANDPAASFFNVYLTVSFSTH